ncbi:hypothetical protein N7466_001441 [Penicillium verhagenii]|uniref:uncharacterized protein n=1 Tax=Penicillium verhagenii TaxID=1562060 RepID=UPI002545268E|nr:uncharacterized protein N7466_001441 [Penicillium verhagenii]KAJ5938307.1 hypothetical protein N7466_001441 [Penicillium verhagenii]
MAAPQKTSKKLFHPVPDSLTMATIKELLETPLGSHDACHVLKDVMEIEHGPSLARQLMEKWNMCRNVQTCKDIIESGDSSYKLCLHEISNCAECHQFFFDTNKPADMATFCFIRKAEDMKQKDRLLFETTLQDLLPRCTWNSQWFRTCWDHIQKFPEMKLPRLDQAQIHQICKFVDPDLADQLFKRGVYLGGLGEGEFSSLNGVMHQESPWPMYNWLFKDSDSTFEEKLTAIALQGYQPKSLAVWRNAAIAAASSNRTASLQIFDSIMHNPPLEIPEETGFRTRLLLLILTNAFQRNPGLVLDSIHLSLASGTEAVLPTEYEMATIQKVQSIGANAFERLGLQDFDSLRPRMREAGLYELERVLANLFEASRLF